MSVNIFEELGNARERMNLVYEEVLKIEKKIEMFSTYDLLSIGEVLSLLMSNYEGIPYTDFKDNRSFKPLCSSFTFYVAPVFNKDYAYSSLTLKPTDIEIDGTRSIEGWRCLEGKDQTIRVLNCVLLPSGCDENIGISYVQHFIDYLFDDRFMNNVKSASKPYLMSVLNSFLEKTLDEQCLRQKEIAVFFDNKKREEQKRIFEKSCLVDRKSIFNNICYLVNCCDDMSAVALNEYSFDKSDVFQKIIISYNNKEFLYETLVDSVQCYPDDYCYADANKDTYINFFEIKYYLINIISGNELLRRYFDFIENYFKQQNFSHKRVLCSDDLNSLFNLISFDSYSFQKRLKILG